MPAKRTWSKCSDCGGLITVDRCYLCKARGGVGTNLVPTVPRFLFDVRGDLSSGNPHTVQIASVRAAANDLSRTEFI